MKYFYNYEMSNLSCVDRVIIDFIEANCDEFLEMSINELSKKCFVSNGAITGLTHKLGFKNFKALQIFLAKESSKNELNHIVDSTNNTSSTISNIYIYSKHALETTKESLNVNDINTAIDLIEGSNLILTFGVGSSSLASNLLFQNLSELGKNIKLLNTVHDLILWTDLNNKDRILIVLFSNTMNTPEIQTIIEIAEKHEIMTIVITKNKSSIETTKLLKICYNTIDKKETDGLNVFGSKTSQIYITEILVSLFSAKRKKKPAKISREELFKK